MNESLSCPQCGEVLEIPVQLLGQPVRCAGCSNVFTPREPRSGADEPPVVPRARSKRDAGRNGTRRVLLIVFALFGLMIFACCGGFGYLMYLAMNPAWQSYDSPTGEFTAKFPGTTQPGTRLTGRGGETATAITARRKLFQEDFFVYFISLTDADGRKTTDKLLDELADGLTAQNPGSSEYRSRVRRQHNGKEAMDVCLELIDDRSLTARIVIANDKAYIVGATSPGDPDGKYWVEEFIEAFNPKSVPEAAAKPAPAKHPFRED